jgi:hypothetical protein
MKYVYCVMINVVLRFYNYVDKLDSTDNDTSDKVLYTQRDVKYYNHTWMIYEHSWLFTYCKQLMIKDSSMLENISMENETKVLYVVWYHRTITNWLKTCLRL